MSRHVKKGDLVLVIAGADKGKEGKVIEVLPGSSRVVVEGVQMLKRHMRKSQQNPQGSIVSREGSIHWSNVVRADAKSKRGAVAKV